MAFMRLNICMRMRMGVEKLPQNKHMHVRMCTCRHYTCIDTCIYIYIYMHTCIHAYLYTKIHTITQTHVHMQVYVSVYTHTYIHTYTHTHTQHMHIYTYTFTRTKSQQNCRREAARPRNAEHVRRVPLTKSHAHPFKHAQQNCNIIYSQEK
jgi:hypothetical protein